MNKIKPIDWDFLLETIEERQCVLFLGNDIENEDDKSKLSEFLEDLHLDYPEDVVAYYPKDDLLLFKDKGTKTRMTSKIRKFYRQPFEPDVKKKIADIPFHLIVNLSPDNSLSTACNENGIASETLHFNRLEKMNLPFNPCEANNPLLIYNLLGSVDDSNSLIISHDDLFDYINAVFAGNKLPDLLRDILKNKTTALVFLGIDFTKWYTQLILTLLELNKEGFVHYASKQKIKHEYIALCEKELKINFVTTEIAGFVNELHQRCAAKGILRTGDTTTVVRHKMAVTKNFRKLLNNSFGGEDLDIFCQDNYPEVYDSFTPGQSKALRIKYLIDFVQKTNAFDKLLKDTEDQNAAYIEKFKPYFEN